MRANPEHGEDIPFARGQDAVGVGYPSRPESTNRLELYRGIIGNFAEQRELLIRAMPKVFGKLVVAFPKRCGSSMVKRLLRGLFPCDLNQITTLLQGEGSPCGNLALDLLYQRHSTATGRKVRDHLFVPGVVFAFIEPGDQGEPLLNGQSGNGVLDGLNRHDFTVARERKGRKPARTEVPMALGIPEKCCASARLARSGEGYAGPSFWLAPWCAPSTSGGPLPMGLR